jgi:hypothetical protein
MERFLQYLPKNKNSYSNSKKLLTMDKKLFFWQDKSGRGFAGTFSKADIKDSFEPTDTDWNGKEWQVFLEEAEVGDKWENAANEVTRTK